LLDISCARYEFIDGITDADASFIALGSDLKGLFFSCAVALINVMVADPANIKRSEKRLISIEKSNAEIDLLFSFLNEILFYKDSEDLLLLPEEIEIKSNEGFVLIAMCAGEPVDKRRHDVLTDAKAVTMHGLSIKERPEGGYSGTVVVDV
jgi:SHS2 domain-containing protein